MSSYTERLDAFAEGRRFARMSRPIRNRADAWCDACGSVQARVLFGLKDERTQQVYFVGEHCLQELAERGAVVRRFCRQSAEEAYAARFDRQHASRPIVAAPSAAARPTQPETHPAAAEETNKLAAYLVLAATGAQPGSHTQIVPLQLDSRSVDSVLHLLKQWSGDGATADRPGSSGADSATEQSQDSTASITGSADVAGPEIVQGPITSTTSKPGKSRPLGRQLMAPPDGA